MAGDLVTELDPAAAAVESALTPSVAEAAAEVTAWTQAMAADAPSGHDVLIAGTDGPKLRLRSLRVVTEHAYATGAPCDGETCEAGGAAHCHRCAEVEADKLLAERDRLREGWRRACALLADAGWDGDERWETIRAEVEEPHAAPDPLNLPAYAWGESVTWNQGRILVPLNRDNETVADLVLDEDAAGTLAAMLEDAAGPDCQQSVARETAERTPHSEESTHADQ